MGTLTGREMRFLPWRESLGWLGAWSLIYVANLPMPLALGHSETANGGTGGMYLAILCLWGLGIVGCLCSRKLAIRLVAGGFVVALLQLHPVPQIIAGMIGISIAHAVVPVGFRNNNTPFGVIAHGGFGLIATLITGGLLMSAAAILGSLALLFPPGRPPAIAKASGPKPGGVFDKQLDG